MKVKNSCFVRKFWSNKFLFGTGGFFIFLSLLVSPNKNLLQASNGIKQWEIVNLPEFTTTNNHHWYDFPLQVIFTHRSSGESITLDGFYDGEDSEGREVWRVRFAPPRAGWWDWESSSSDSQMNGISGDLHADEPTESDKDNNPNYRGHVKINKSGDRPGRYFVYADGTPFFWIGDTNWSMNTYRCGVHDGDFYEWLDDRKAKEFTVILSQYYALDERNEGGYAFLTNHSKPGNGNFDDLNPAYFQQLDTRLKAIWDNGFVLAAHPTWISEDNISLSNAERVSRYLLARYGAYNIVWSLSGEYQYSYEDNRPGGSWFTSDWNSLGNFIQEHNPFGHPVSVHSSGRTDWENLTGIEGSGEQSSGGEFHSQSWLDHNWLQTGHSDDRLWRVAQRTEENYNRTPPKPVHHSEGFYENISSEGASAYEVRWQAWSAYLNGAGGHGYGASGVWQFYDPDDPYNETGYEPWDGTSWSAALNYGGSGQLQYLHNFFDEFDWWKLEPHRDWLQYNDSENPMPTSSNITPPHLSAVENELYVVYIPRGNSDEEIKITNLGDERYLAKRYNPRTGGWADINGGDPITPVNGQWTIPNWVYNDDNDWALKLTVYSSIPGDLDGDGDVDIFDLVIVGNCFGLEATGDCERADANNSGGTIDIFDLVMVGSHFGN